MPLTWSFENTPFGEDDIWSEEKDNFGQHWLKPPFYSIVFGTMALGIGQLTEATVPKFIERYKFLCAVHGGPVFSHYEVSEDGGVHVTRDSFDPQVVWKSIGFGANVGFEKKMAWLSRQTRPHYGASGWPVSKIRSFCVEHGINYAAL